VLCYITAIAESVYYTEMMSDPLLIEKVVARLHACVAEVPFCAIKDEMPDSNSSLARPDWIGRLRVGDKERLILIEAQTNGQPRRAREAANAFLRWGSLYPNAVHVFAAPYVSPDAAEILGRENIGYVDLSGNCRLTFDRVYIRTEGRPNQFTQRRDLRSLYSPKAERVLRALLSEPRRGWKIKELAKAASVSLGQASNVKRLLEDREWLKPGKDGFRLVQPDRLLGEWSENYNYRRNKSTDYYSMDPVPQIEAKLAAACDELGCGYAIAGLSAAWRLAPYVRYQRAMAYVAGEANEVVERVGLKPVASGPNVTLLTPYDEGVFVGGQVVEGIRVTSSVQTYLDVRGFRGRGEEAAEAILREVIKPTW
jgi:hypothetical protein